MKSQRQNEWPTSDTGHITSALMQKTYKRINATKKQNLDNKIYFAKRQVQQKGKSPSKLATILRADKHKKEQKTEKKN